ncbi:MAG: phage tail sheath C-terminal domain-containing protein [Bacteroidota bacterium]
MAFYKTPGVYIEEKSAFPNSIVAVETAVPAFIGYTEKAERLGKTSFNKPIRVTSFVEYEQFFGGAPDYLFKVVEKEDDQDGETFPLGKGADKKEYKIQWTDKLYRLHNCVKLFYQNGGGNCWIISVGNYEDTIEKDSLVDAVGKLLDEPEPTMVLAPDALFLKNSEDEYQDTLDVYKAILDHCNKTMSRIGIFDVPGGDSEKKLERVMVDDLIEKFRSGIGTNCLDYGAAYFPWLETNVISDREITFMNFDPALKDLLCMLANGNQEITDAIERAFKTEILPEEDRDCAFKIFVLENGQEEEKRVDEAGLISLDAGLRESIPVYKNIIIKEAVKKINLMPPSSAMAGVYTAVDNKRGVWKAPANVSLSSVSSPNVNINNDLNNDLNMPLNGKAVNAIRSFPGQGAMVWGARTLDGNSQDSRYVNVRRTMIFLEMSVKAAARAYVFEPNDASTWTLVSGMISNFLNNVWKAGGLFGSTPGEAYDVQIGLGTTMTANDILDGYMRITVRVAVVRPAEFIVITFQQKMAEA